MITYMRVALWGRGEGVRSIVCLAGGQGGGEMKGGGSSLGKDLSKSVVLRLDEVRSRDWSQGKKLAGRSNVLGGGSLAARPLCYRFPPD